MIPITFKIEYTAEYPLKQHIIIQLNPFAWMGTSPNVGLGNNQWTYTLYGPLK